ncbi:MAG: HEPN domain-containing protein [Thermodesulfobacteriota bacterium]|nr:HEPN domain-containing protein [Thermodesulfobacteriota bacterium]
MKKHVTYWLESAEHDLDVAESLYANGKYDWCLFLGHLVLEKILKAYYVKYNEELPPRTHDLVRLSDMVGLVLEDEILEFFDIVNTFNVSTRYPDEKFKFYRLCTLEFAQENFTRIKEMRKWLLKKIYP